MNLDLKKEIENLFPLMKERLQEIQALRGKIDQLDWNISRKSEKYYPVRFFADGLSAYIYVFDNAAVYYSWIAVEHGLLIRLGPDLLSSAINTNHNRYPGEKKLVEIARESGILSRDKERVAHRLRKIRNDYIHYINIMWDQHNRDIHLRELVKSRWSEIVSEIKNTARRDKQAEVLTILESMKNEIQNDGTVTLRRIPYIPGDPPNSDQIRFRNIRLKQFANWIAETNAIGDQQKRFEYGIERKDALDCLRWSDELLTYLGFLK